MDHELHESQEARIARENYDQAAFPTGISPKAVSHPITPQEIAMQAVFEAYPGLQSGLSEDTAEAYRLRDGILSAAAKIVRESGAHHLEAITTDQGRLCEAVHHGKGDYHTGLAPCPVCLRIEAALQSLRALTEHKP